MSGLAQSRHFDRAPVTSGLPCRLNRSTQHKP